MKEGFRQSMAWLHTWTGLVVGWVLFFVFMTGTAGYFDDEITRWMQPERPLAFATAAELDARGVAAAQTFLQHRAPHATRWSIRFPKGRGETDWRVSWSDGEARDDGEHRRSRGGRRRPESATIDPATGREIPRQQVAEERDTAGGVGLYRLHYQLHYVSKHSAILIVGACTMLMLLAILTGVITHKKIFKDFFTFRPAKGQRSWLDMHNLISVAGLPFFVMITYTGLMFFQYAYMPAAMTAAYGVDRQWDNDGYTNPLNPRVNGQFDPSATGDRRRDRRAGVAASGVAAPLTPLPALVDQAEAIWGKGKVASIEIERPGDRNARVSLAREDQGLIRAAGDNLRFDGVTGALIAPVPVRQGATWQAQDGMIALHEGLFAGPVLRWLYFLAGLLGCGMIGTGLILWTVKRRQKQHADKRDIGFRLVETMNVGTIVGLPLGIAAYFWANRLLPASMADRAAWEFHCLFLAMGATLLWASLRPPIRAWHEALWASAMAYGTLPILNLITTDRHLGMTLPAGDWVLAGFDLTMIALAILLTAAALHVRRKMRAPAIPSRRALREARA